MKTKEQWADLLFTTFDGAAKDENLINARNRADDILAEIQQAKKDAVLETLNIIDDYIPMQTKAREQLEKLKQDSEV